LFFLNKPFFLLIIGNESIVSSTYLVNLTDHSPTMSPDINPNATTYFEAVEISVSVNGTYNIASIGSLDTVGYLFINSFNINFQSINLLIRNDYGTDQNFGMSYRLGASQKYFLLATTYNSRVTGSFQISIFGPSAVNFIKLNVSSELKIFSNYSLGRFVYRFYVFNWNKFILFISFN